MPRIKLDNIEYNTEDLSEHGLAILKNLQFLEGQLQKIKNEIGVYQTAQRTYAAALMAEIKKLGIQPNPPERAS
jgi:hypothetical protein